LAILTIVSVTPIEAGHIVSHNTRLLVANISNAPRHLTNYTQSRIDHVLAVFAGWVDKVKVSLADRSGESGNIACEIRVRLVPSGIWIIQESRDANPYVAIENAAEGIARTLGRQLARLKTLQSLTTAA
jgi:ribosome-associated translation inhibitor RaiA